MLARSYITLLYSSLKIVTLIIGIRSLSTRLLNIVGQGFGGQVFVIWKLWFGIYLIISPVASAGGGQAIGRAPARLWRGWLIYEQVVCLCFT